MKNPDNELKSDTVKEPTEYDHVESVPDGPGVVDGSSSQLLATVNDEFPDTTSRSSADEYIAISSKMSENKIDHASEKSDI